MNGEQLLQALLTMNPEQRQFPVVVEGADHWFYDAIKVETINCEDGRVVHRPPSETIVIRSLGH